MITREIVVNSHSNIKLTERELDIMQILWKLGRGSVTEVHYNLLKQDLILPYTTVQSVINRLEKKGYLGRDKSKRVHRYLPMVKEFSAVTAAFQRLADRFFGGSVEALAVSFIEGLTPQQRKRMEALMAELLRKAHELEQ